MDYMEPVSSNLIRNEQKFAHVLRFKCPNCGKSITAVRCSEKMSREKIAPLLFQQACGCGWSGKLAGLAATRHSVEFWPDAARGDSQTPASECDRL
jgi:predicted RNA-binding Zn-ribbon protein involved in translation (DUF1610 family)